MAVRHYKVILTTVGTVHVGNGKKLGSKDYFCNGDKGVSILDVPKFVSRLSHAQLESYCDFLKNSDSSEGLQDFLNQHRELKKTAEACVVYRVDAQLAKARGGSYQYLDVAEFVKDAYGLPYIPGSSVKGMLRTAILTHMILVDRSSYAPLFSEREAQSPESRSRAGRAINRRAFWQEYPDPEDRTVTNDIMRYVSVSDSKPLAPSALAFVKKYDKFSRSDRADHKMNLGKNLSNQAYYDGNELPIYYRECLKPGTHIELTIDVDERIDGYLLPLKLDIAGLQSVLQESFNLYKSSFLDHFELGESSGSQSGVVNDGRCQHVYSTGPFAGTRCRNTVLDGGNYCSKHQDCTNGGSDSCTVYLGGGVDFDSKTVINALIEDEYDRLDAIAHILYAQFPTKLDHSKYAQLWQEVQSAGFAPKDMRPKGKRHKEDHRHWRDSELKVSPHTAKLGKLGGKTYPMGKCSIQIEEC